MMQIYLYLISLILLNHLVECTQPYFPPQILFAVDNCIVAIDEINQRAYQSFSSGIKSSEDSYVLKRFPYATPNSPQSKYYVQLLEEFLTHSQCMYGTYWKYGGNYWYANVTCKTDTGPSYPCEEIYFRKNTDVPVRSTQVIYDGWEVRQNTRTYLVISMGKPDEKYFNSMSKDWASTCQDVNLGVLYDSQTIKINLHESAKVQVWLPTPPHWINGNDTVIIQWKSTECTDCVTWKPKQLSFNSKTFQERQTLTITCVKNGSKSTLMPIFNGGGFDLVRADNYTIVIE